MSCLVANRSRFALWLLTAFAACVLPSALSTNLLAQPQPSADNREERYVFVGWTAIGLDASTLYAPPLTAGSYFGRHFMAGVDYGSMKGSQPAEVLGHLVGVKDGLKPGDIKDPQFTNIGVYARWIPENSFFLSGSLHQRRWAGIARVNAADDTTFGHVGVSTRLKAETWVAALGIGNAWLDKSGGTLVVTWALLSGSIDSSSDFKVPEQGLTASEQANARRKFDKIAKRLIDDVSRPGGALVTVGLSF